MYCRIHIPLEKKVSPIQKEEIGISAQYSRVAPVTKDSHVVQSWYAMVSYNVEIAGQGRQGVR